MPLPLPRACSASTRSASARSTTSPRVAGAPSRSSSTRTGSVARAARRPTAASRPRRCARTRSKRLRAGQALEREHAARGCAGALDAARHAARAISAAAPPTGARCSASCSRSSARETSRSAARPRHERTVGTRAPARVRARRTSPARANYVDDLCAGTARAGARLAGAGAARARARRSASTRRGAARMPGVLRVLTARRRARARTTPARCATTSRCFPREVSFHGQPWPGCWRRAKRRRAWRARSGARSSYEPLPAMLSHRAGASPRSSFLTEPERMRARRRRGARWRSAPHRLEGELVARRPGALLPRDAGRARLVDESGRHARALVDAAPDRDAGDRRARARACRKHQVVVQCLRMGGAFGGKEVQANAWAARGGARRASSSSRPVRVRLDARAGHEHDRQAPPVSGRASRSASTTTGKLLGARARSCSATAAGASISARRS